MATIPVTDNIELDESELRFDFMRAAGPGGQNVNKVETAVQLRFNAADSPSLPDDLRSRLLHLAGSRATSDGEIILVARAGRTQPENRARVVNTLIDLIRRAAIPPKPRHATRPTRASQVRRVEAKKRRGETKRLRGARFDE